MEPRKKAGWRWVDPYVWFVAFALLSCRPRGSKSSMLLGSLWNETGTLCPIILHDCARRVLSRSLPLQLILKALFVLVSKALQKKRRNFRHGDGWIRMFCCIRHFILQTSWFKFISAVGQSLRDETGTLCPVIFVG